MSKVSVIMPTYNRADTIRRAVGSVQAQGLRDWELVVVDEKKMESKFTRPAK